MRHFNLLRLFKRNNRLTNKTHHRSHRSPFLSGYNFAFSLIASLLLVTCGMNRSLAVPLIQNPTPQSEIQSTVTLQPGLSGTIPPVAIRQAAMTPLPSVPNTGTPVTTASVTPLASATLPLTPTATQPAATSTPGVLATSDLLFISDNCLLRWDHVTHYSSSLAENVVTFSTNASGSKIALLRPRRVAANGNELFDLDLLEISSKQTRHLIEGTPRLLDLALSPDGAWLAYQQSQDGKPAITLLRLSDPANPINLGLCEAPPSNSCTPPVWSSDSQSLIWSDQRGLWIAGVLKGSASLFHPNTIEVPDPQGKTSLIEAQFLSPEWSPAGRFVLVQVIPNFSNASWHAVIDSLTGRLGQVLDSYKLSPKQVSVGWLPNGQLAVARSSDQEQQTPAAIQVWDVLATNPALLVSAEQYKFPSGVLSSGATSVTFSNPAQKPLRLDWIQQSNPGHLLFGAIQPDNPSQTSLYDLNLLTNSVNQFAQLTSEIQQVLWAPDGSGMLIITSDGQALFTSADGKEIFKLEPTVKTPLTGFIWLPPSLRK
jgi:hypothetical protein